MTTTQDGSGGSGAAPQDSIDMPLEVLVIPVSDVDRAKAFYAGIGWRLDADRAIGDFRLVQFTPPGSSCSIQFGHLLTSAPAGSASGLILAVADIQAARAALASGGAEPTEVYHCAEGTACRFQDGTGLFERVTGPEPGHTSYSSFVSFRDPDGNGWVLQEVTARLAGRVDPGQTSFRSTGSLADAMIRAAKAHGEHEKRIGHADADWPHWYAAYMAADQAGTELPQ
jgi:catechol 2,3-dioxygenase-like lactoylglutathione lyase family enzyme